jgi:hypothetical protein
MLDVEFDFFDPQPHDYHSIKLLLAQLLSHDAKNLELEGVVNLVLEQKLVGSTVKTDGAEGDPYAVLTVLNLNVHKVSPMHRPIRPPAQLTFDAGQPLHRIASGVPPHESSSLAIATRQAQVAIRPFRCGP